MLHSKLLCCSSFFGGPIKYIIDLGCDVIPLHICVFCFRFVRLRTKIRFRLVLCTTCSSMQQDRASHEYVLIPQWSVAFDVFYTPQRKAPAMRFNFNTYVQDNIHGVNAYIATLCSSIKRLQRAYT